MNRRKFLHRSFATGAVLLLISGRIFRPAQASEISPKKKPVPKGFKLGYIGRLKEFNDFTRPLKGLVSVPIIRTSLKKLSSDELTAVIVSPKCRGSVPTVIKLLDRKVAVLWQLPGHTKQNDLQKIIQHSFSGSPHLVLFDPKLYQRNVLKLKEMLAGNALGKPESALLQLNFSDSGIKDEKYHLTEFILLFHFITGYWPEKVALEKPGEQFRSKYPESFFFTFFYRDFRLTGSTIPEYYSKVPGWMLRFSGQKGQVSIMADGSMEWEDGAHGKSTTITTKESDQLLGTRLQIEDFSMSVKEKRPFEPGIELLKYRLSILNALLKSSQTMKEEKI